MKFDLPTPQPLPDVDTSLQVGNVYPAQGGTKTKYWIVIALHDGMAHLIGINTMGEITKTQSYGRHVFDGSCFAFTRNQTLIGKCAGIEAINLEIDWLTK